MAFQVSKSGDVMVIDVEGQLIVGNRQELKQKILDELEGGRAQVRRKLLGNRLHRLLRARRPRVTLEEDPGTRGGASIG